MKPLARHPVASEAKNGPDDEMCQLVPRIKAAGQELHRAIQAVMGAVQANSRSAREFARTLKVHPTLASRLLKAGRTDDPLAAIHRMPRGEGLRMFLEAAKPTVAAAAIARAEDALVRLEELVHGELGGWDGLEAAITEWLPDARAKFELANKHLVFKGMANIMGVRSDTQADTAIWYPDATGERCDIAILEGMVNLRRLRPSVRVPVTVHIPHQHAPRPLPYEMQGLPAENATDVYPLLKPFCSTPLPALEAVKMGENTTYMLAGNDIGENSGIDVFTATVARRARSLYRDSGAPPVRPSWSAGVNLPAKTLLINLLLHEDIWPEAEPQLMMYDMHVRGVSLPDDPSRELDRLDVAESLQSLGKGVERFRASEVGRQVEMIQYLCERLGWDFRRLRGYRVRVQYPLTNAQYCIAFPPAPLRGANVGER